MKNEIIKHVATFLKAGEQTVGVDNPIQASLYSNLINEEVNEETEVEEITQPFATRVENVNPYLVTFFRGVLDLNPSSVSTSHSETSNDSINFLFVLLLHDSSEESLTQTTLLSN